MNRRRVRWTIDNQEQLYIDYFTPLLTLSRARSLLKKLQPDRGITARRSMTASHLLLTLIVVLQC